MGSRNHTRDRQDWTLEASVKRAKDAGERVFSAKELRTMKARRQRREDAERQGRQRLSPYQKSLLRDEQNKVV
jgi:hypothetical protein